MNLRVKVLKALSRVNLTRKAKCFGIETEGKTKLEIAKSIAKFEEKKFSEDWKKISNI
jgi:hypothetical protein